MNVMKFLVSLYFFMFWLFSIGIAQKNDYHWPMGYYGEASIEFLEMDSTNYWTPFSLNFNFDPMEIQYFPKRRLKFYSSNASFSSDQGELICYSNGMHINGANDRRVYGGDTINFNNYWEYFSDPSGEGWGFGLPQGTIFIPNPASEKQIIYFNSILNVYKDTVEALWYGIVAFDESLNASVIKKDVSILNKDQKAGGLKAVKHANDYI
jgi:hypothetical protein